MTILFSDQFHDQEEKAVNVARDLRMPQFELEKVENTFLNTLLAVSYVKVQFSGEQAEWDQGQGQCRHHSGSRQKYAHTVNGITVQLE